MNEVLEFLQEGVSVNVAFDVESAIILGVVLFLAASLALLLYAKVMQ